MDKKNLIDINLNEIKPEVYTFADQSEKEVSSLFDHIKKTCEKNNEFFKKILEEKPESDKKPYLIYDNAPRDTFEVRNIKWQDNFVENTNRTTTAVWRKLAGVNPKENVEAVEKASVIMSSILLTCKKKCTSDLSIEWSDECWNQCLIINKAKTKIRYNDLIAALEGLCNIVSEDHAIKIISDTVVEKINNLFI